MSNQYYNLMGWLRDVRGVLGGHDERSESYRVQLLDIVEELTVAVGIDGFEYDDVRDDESVSEELEPPDADDDLVVQRPGVGRRARAERRLVGPSRVDKVGGSAGMADEVPRDVPAEGKRRRGRAAPVARARGGVSRGKK